MISRGPRTGRRGVKCLGIASLDDQVRGLTTSLRRDDGRRRNARPLAVSPENLAAGSATKFPRHATRRPAFRKDWVRSELNRYKKNVSGVLRLKRRPFDEPSNSSGNASLQTSLAD